MYKCQNCGAEFTDPYEERVCWEDFFGVGGSFPNKSYGYVDACPYCGSTEIEEDYDD